MHQRIKYNLQERPLCPIQGADIAENQVHLLNYCAQLLKFPQCNYILLLQKQCFVSCRCY
jgi:hypothetical protein